MSATIIAQEQDAVIGGGGVTSAVVEQHMSQSEDVEVEHDNNNESSRSLILEDEGQQKPIGLERKSSNSSKKKKKKSERSLRKEPSSKNDKKKKNGDKRHSLREEDRKQSSEQLTERIANSERATRDGDDQYHSPGRLREIDTKSQPSPSAVARSRRDSPVVKTRTDSLHELSEGRESIVLPPDLHHNRSVSVGVRKSQLASDRPQLLIERSKSDLADQHEHPAKYLQDPHPLRLDAWTEPPGTTFQVRGANYTKDSKKMESLPSVFRLLTVDILKCDEPIMTGLASHPNERVQRALARERETGEKELPEFMFIVNLVIPGNEIYHKVFYFGIDDVSTITDTTTPYGNVANKFFFGDSDDFRNETFKLIPRIVDGNFIVRKAVGSKPAILGRKIQQTYIRTSRFLELIVDISSEPIARKIVKLSLGYSKTLVVDMAFVLEGTEPICLPERVTGAVRIKNLDFKDRDGKRLLSNP